MSGGGGRGGERTEKATPKRLKKARRDGQIQSSHGPVVAEALGEPDGVNGQVSW